MLIGLGIWQLDRKAWKEDLIEKMTTRLVEPRPHDLPPREHWERLDQQARRIPPRDVSRPNFSTARRRWSTAPARPLRPDVTGPGYWVLHAGAACRRQHRRGQPRLRAERQEGRSARDAEGQLTGIVDIVGVMRWPEARGLFTPADDPKGNVWYRARSIGRWRRRKEWGAVAPFYIDQEAPSPPGGLPNAGRLDAESAEQPPAICADLVRPRAGAGRRLCRLARGPSAAPASDAFL